MAQKDYYKILGVDKNASTEEIKKAFRKLAHQHHPDKKGGDEAKFKEINEAWQVLGDDTKRKQYDQFGSDFEQAGGFGGGGNPFQGGFGGFQGMNFDFGNGGFGDIFGEAFGFGGGGRSGPKRGHDIQVDVQLEFREAVFGIEKEIRLTKNNQCDVCSGNGAEPGTKMTECSECKGQGQVRRVQQTILGAMQTVTTCPRCQGAGKIPDKQCKHCHGEGRTKSESMYKVKIPAGIDDGGTIRLVGKGEYPGKGGQAGDLYIRVHVKEDKHLVRDGNDIFTEAHISFPDATLGAVIEIETLDGKKKIEVPEGTQSHQQIRLRDLGVPHLNSSRRGDQYIKIIVDTPKKISKSAKKLLEELKQELS